MSARNPSPHGHSGRKARKISDFWSLGAPADRVNGTTIPAHPNSYHVSLCKTLVFWPIPWHHSFSKA